METSWTKCWRWQGRLASFLPGVHDTRIGMAAAMECDANGRRISSTAQDLNRGRPTEIDALNGYVARRALNWRPVPVITPIHASEI